MKIFFSMIICFTLLLPAQEQFKSSHQRDWEFYKANPQEIGKSVALPSMTKRSDLMKVQTMNKVVYGFHPSWQNGAESNYYFSLLTHLVYFSADINAATGGFSTTNNWATAGVVTTAQQYGVKVHLAVVLFSSHATLLSSTSLKNTLIQNILTQLAVRNADGLNVDFESMSSTVKTDFRVFMKQLGDSLKAHNYEFVIELPAVDWSNIFDATFFTTLDPVTDFYFAMLYDYWWSGSATAGPSSPLRASNVTTEWHVLRSIDTYVNTKGCPANKFIAGFPNYGRDWAVTSTNANADTLPGSSNYSRTYTIVKNEYIDTIPSNRQFWSTTYNTRYYNYVSSGNWRQTWYDDSLSWAKKFDSIKVKSVAGTGMWALGYDGSEPEMWGALKTAFAQSANPTHTSFDNFESGVGHFSTSPTFSGSTVGISTSSTAALTNDAANNGAQALQIVLIDNTSITTNWSVRQLSGGGTVANNTAFNTTGYFGFWLKTTSSKTGLQTAISVDDGPGGTLISSKQNINGDGAWHLYEWNLSSTTWTILAGSDAILNGPTATLDAVMLYANNDAADWTLFLDDVSHNASGTLPVELENYSAVSKQMQVQLDWRTATEENNYGFEIEKRAMDNGQLTMDNWKRIGFVQGNGTSNSPHSYSFTDALTATGTYVYRLRQIDRNGAFRYSQEIIVTTNSSPDRYTLEQNYPNPFNPVTTIQFSIPAGLDKQRVSLTIYDMLGRETALLVNEEKSAGTYSIQWNATGFASGIYFYTLRYGNFAATKKMIFAK